MSYYTPVKPALLIPLLTIILAADLISVWTDHPSIMLQHWPVVEAYLTPTCLVEVLELLATGYLLVVPLLEWQAVRLTGVFPWLMTVADDVDQTSWL